MPVKTLLSVVILASMLTGCVSLKYDVTYDAPCSTVLTDEDTAKVDGAPLPQIGDAYSLFQFGDAQTGKLDEANGKIVHNQETIQRCEAHDRSMRLIPQQRVIGIAIKKKPRK